MIIVVMVVIIIIIMIKMMTRMMKQLADIMALIPRDLLLLTTMVAVHILFQVSLLPILSPISDFEYWQGPMVGVQALIWYRDLHVEVSIIFVLDSIAVSQLGPNSGISRMIILIVLIRFLV